MKLRASLYAWLVAMAFASGSYAGGAVSLSWNSCTGPIDRAVVPGDHLSLNASLLGQSEGSGSYDVILRIGPGHATFPDAWRFDQLGCQGPSRFSITQKPRISEAATCPVFEDSVGPPTILIDYSYDPTFQRAVLTFAHYQLLPKPSSDPSQRYFLVGFQFDHTVSVDGSSVGGQSCGGLEQPMCFAIDYAHWLTLADDELAWAIDQGFATANDPTNSSHCPGATPARSTTWGRVKDQYR
jgi:hypothetical protein